MKLLLGLVFLTSLQTPAFGQEKLFWLYQRIPEHQALSQYGEAHARELKASSIKALIWNIKKTEMKNWEPEFKKLGRGKDLFVLQEVYQNSLFNQTIGQIEKFHWSMATSFRVKKDNYTGTGTMIGAAVQPAEAIARHSPDVEPIVLTPKALTMVKYPIEGRQDELLVISVHAINFQSTGAFKRHMDQAFQEIREHSGPVLFAGDFNTWNKPRMGFLMRSIAKLGLEEVKFKNAHLKMKFAGMPLDHSFIRGLSVKDAEVVYSDGSDHKPLLMEFDVK